VFCPFLVQVKKEWEEAEHQAVNLPKAERQTLIQVRAEGSEEESYWCLAFVFSLNETSGANIQSQKTTELEEQLSCSVNSCLSEEIGFNCVLCS